MKVKRRTQGCDKQCLLVPPHVIHAHQGPVLQMLTVNSAFISLGIILSRVTCFTNSAWASIPHMPHLCLLPSPHKCPGQSCSFKGQREQSVSLAPENVLLVEPGISGQCCRVDARSGRHLGPLRLEKGKLGDLQSHSDFRGLWMGPAGWEPTLVWSWVDLGGHTARVSSESQCFLSFRSSSSLFKKGTCGNPPPPQLSGKPAGLRESCIEQSGEVSRHLLG